MPSVLAPQLNARALQVSGLPGAATATSRYAGAVSGAAPTTGTFLAGDHVADMVNGGFWFCLTGGTPGTWIQIPALGSSSPQPLGLSLAGFSPLAAPMDHVHPKTGLTSGATPQAIAAAGSAGVTPGSFSLGDHVHPIGSSPPCPLGLIAYNQSSATVAQITTTEVIALTTTAALDSSRVYEVTTSNIMGQSQTLGDYLNLFIRQSAAGGSVTTSSTIVAQTIVACPVANNIKDDKGLYFLLDAPATGTYQFGLTYSKASGTGPMGPQVAATRPLVISVKDVGPALSAVS